MTDPQSQLPFDTPARMPVAACRQEHGSCSVATAHAEVVCIAARAGRLTATVRATGETLPALGYPMPEDAWIDDERLGELGVASDEERVASYVECTAQELFERVRDALALQELADRFQQGSTLYGRAEIARALRRLHLTACRHYSDQLAEVAELLGEPAANDLGRWIDRLVERADAARGEGAVCAVPKPSVGSMP